MRTKAERYKRAKKTRMKTTSQKSMFQLQQRHSDLSNTLQEESKHSESEQLRWVKDCYSFQFTFTDLQWSYSVLQFNTADHQFKSLVSSFAFTSFCN